MTYPNWINMLICFIRIKSATIYDSNYYISHLKNFYNEYAALRDENEKLKLTIEGALLKEYQLNDRLEKENEQLRTLLDAKNKEIANMKKEEPEIKEGDIVKDRTGAGPKMIVDGILDDGCIRTKWWYGSHYTREIFHPNALEKV